MPDILTEAERLRRMSKPQRIAALRSMVAAELPRSVARRQLEAALRAEMTKELRRETPRRRRRFRWRDGSTS
jgi:uncharacterized protein involved in exopolysaccharide biosynthesis